jgi:uncharacterized protein YbaA (DUF1428 family)
MTGAAGYLDAFALPVPRDGLDNYRGHAAQALQVWMDHGALSAVEAVADDVPDGTVTSFPMAVKLEPGEVVVVSFITYRDRAHRDEVNARVIADPRMQHDDVERPFDGRRLIWGGFVPILTAGAFA